MRTADKKLHSRTYQLFAKRKAKGLYATDMIFKDLSHSEKQKLRKEAAQLIFKDGLV